MTTDVLPAHWSYGLRHPLDRAMSSDAERSRVARQFSLGATPSVSVDKAYEDSVESLVEVFKEASEANWDGYGARQVSGATLEQAITFLTLLPSSFTRPEFSAHPNGELAFEWYFGPRRVLTVSINESGRLSYAALIGERRRHGTEPLLDTLPDTIILAIRELSSHD